MINDVNQLNDFILTCVKSEDPGCKAVLNSSLSFKKRIFLPLIKINTMSGLGVRFNKEERINHVIILFFKNIQNLKIKKKYFKFKFFFLKYLKLENNINFNRNLFLLYFKLLGGKLSFFSMYSYKI